MSGYPSGPPPAGWNAAGAPYGPPAGAPQYGPPAGAPNYPAYPQPGYGPPQVPVQQLPPYGGADPGTISMAPVSSGGHHQHVPHGLEYLTMVDQLLVHQKVEMLEAFIGFESKNKYTVKNTMGQKIYYAVEDSGCLTRNCCGPWRPFDMRIMDANKDEIIHLNRPLACDSCWFPCCLQKLEVSSPPGTIIGTVEQNWSILSPSFSVKDASGHTVLTIEGPFCTFSICGDVEFTVKSAASGQKVGKISKQWSGLLKEVFTDTDNFGVSFPMDLDVRMKAVMIGAVFLIDFMFFEKVGGDERDRPGMFS